MEQPDKGMRCDLVIGTLGNDDQRAASLGVARSKLEKHHSCIAVCHKIDRIQAETIQHLAQFFGSLNQSNGLRAGLMAAVHDDTPCLAERTYLACIDKFEMFKNGYKNQGSPVSDVYERHVCCANGCALPE